MIIMITTQVPVPAELRGRARLPEAAELCDTRTWLIIIIIIIIIMLVYSYYYYYLLLLYFIYYYFYY